MTVDGALLSLARRFSAAGFRAYAVGGYVRARILGRPFYGEIDIATDATPQEMRKFCEVVGEYGAGFGTLVVQEGGERFECTTFRKDVGIRDGRRPVEVVFGRDLREDARRRDFTCNAVYFDPLTGAYEDPFDGIGDWRAGWVRFVGDARDRLKEDSLRALRYVRFAAPYWRMCLPQEVEAVRAAMPAAAMLAPERIVAELEKMLFDFVPADAFRLLADLGFLAAALPELDALRRVPGGAPYHLEGDVWEHTCLVLNQLREGVAAIQGVTGERLVMPDHRAYRWAALFHDAGKAATYVPDADGRPRYPGHAVHSVRAFMAAAARLRLPKRTVALASWLVENHGMPFRFGDLPPVQAGLLMADPRFPTLLALANADDHGRLSSSGENRWRAAGDRYRRFLASGVLGKLLTGADVLARWPNLAGTQVGEKLREENAKILGGYAGA